MNKERTTHSIAEELTTPHHLVTPASHGKPLCGEASLDVAIGSFVEHLDDNREFVREIFGQGGKPATPCQECLTLYPLLANFRRDEREPKRITPFNLRVNVAFVPDGRLAGYRLNAHGIAEIGDRHVVVGVFPQLSYSSAQWFHLLSFNMGIDANLIVPLVNRANKED